MSTSAYLVCPPLQLMIGLGKPLRAPDGTISSFDQGLVQGTERAQIDRALWKFLAQTAGENLVVVFSGDDDFETIAGYRQIGGWTEDGNIPFAAYLSEPPTTPAALGGTDGPANVVYYGSLGAGRTRANPSGLFRRSVVDGYAVDEMFTRRLQWEPTTYLREYEFGHNDVDHVEITPAEAHAFVERLTAKGRS